jgi:hypothetical protein
MMAHRKALPTLHNITTSPFFPLHIFTMIYPISWRCGDGDFLTMTFPFHVTLPHVTRVYHAGAFSP